MEDAIEKPLDRTPPAPVRRQLRKEVGFGCPIPGCRKPFLEYHHFDPPWAEEPHHRPEGMIALCTEHHPMADAETWSKARFLEMKARTYSEEEVRAMFPWQFPNPLVRLGGNYTAGAVPVIQVDGEDLLGLSVGDAGLLELSFAIRDADGADVAKMVGNDFTASPDKMHDLQVSIGANSIQINNSPRGIILRVESSKISYDNLLNMLVNDGWGNGSERIASYAMANCSEAGRIRLLDFRNLVLQVRGQQLRIREGLTGPGLRLQRTFLPGLIQLCYRGNSMLIGVPHHSDKS